MRRGTRKRCVIVGTGGRAANFIVPIITTHRGHCELVGFCDSSQVRMDHYNRELREKYRHAPVPTCKPRSFRKLLRETRPDTVIVTSVDSTHHTYIIAAVEAGLEVITEKPMTIDAPKCRRILNAARKHRGRIRVAFNYRWQPNRTKVRDLIARGTIGEVHSVHLEYLLDTRHGADYFRRWHSQMDSSGGLLVHKATHHFDLVNWWIDAVPEEVFARGELFFYGRNNARKRGDSALTRYSRYTGRAPASDPFSLDLLADDRLKSLYHDAEKESGYIRDQNVFRTGIDIHDSMSVLVRYRTGALLTYSLNCFAPREGMRVGFNGSHGRIEYHAYTGCHIPNETGDDRKTATESNAGIEVEGIRVFPRFRPPYDVPTKTVKGGHGGADPKLARQIFDPKPPIDRYGRSAGHEQGAASVLIGIAANQSIETNRPVRIDKLAPLNPRIRHLSGLK